MSVSKLTEELEVFAGRLKSLQELRSFNGAPSEFWPAYLNILVEISEAVVGIIAVRVNTAEKAQWQVLAVSPDSMRKSVYPKLLFDHLDKIADVCIQENSGFQELSEGGLVSLRLNTGNNEQLCIASFLLKEFSAEQAISKAKILESISDVTSSYQFQRTVDDLKAQTEQFAGVLDLMVIVNSHKKFLAAAIAFCNELAGRHKCDRVSLGWYDNGYIRMQAINNVDNFDRKMEAVQKLEMVMEEAFDQDTEIIIPVPAKTAHISRDHEEFARANGVSFMCSLPLRLDNKLAAVCTFERKSAPFSEVELRILRLACDQVIRRLEDLKYYDRWFGARMGSSIRQTLGRFVGFEHTWLKVLAVFVSILLAFICFVPLPYRIDASIILRTDDVSYLTAPYDGHIENVKVRIGDRVNKGQALLDFDRRDLLLEEEGLMAEENRYSREFEKARASNELADMRIAEATREQVKSKLDLVRSRINRSVIPSPFDSVVIEGDLMERVGLPVKQGDVLFKLARVDRLYAELEVRESDIQNVKSKFNGEVALVSRPQEINKIEVFRIEPAAVSKEKKNVFIVHCNFTKGCPEWWLPGMTGVAKINAGKRTLLWMLTHRTIDFLRLRLWW